MTPNVYQYFTQVLGVNSEDETLRELPVDTNCGRDCVRAIDAAKLLMRDTPTNLHQGVIDAADCTVQVFWRG